MGNKIRMWILLGRWKGLHTLGSNIYMALILLMRGCWYLFSHGYATLSSLKSQCATLRFQDPWTKFWLFDILVTVTLLYGVKTCGPSFNKEKDFRENFRENFSLNAYPHDKKQTISSPNLDKDMSKCVASHLPKHFASNGIEKFASMCRLDLTEKSLRGTF